MSERPMRLNLDRLVVHGMAPAHARALGPLVQRELERLVADGGVPPHLASGGRVPALPALRAAPGAPPHVVAADVARAVYGAMGGSSRTADGTSHTAG
jgi:hypothetical protein